MNELALFAGAGGGILGENSLDGAPSALLRLIPMPVESCSNDRPTASSDTSLYGTTSAPSEENSGEVPWILLQADFHAPTSQPVDSRAESLAPSLDCSSQWQGSSMKSSHHWSSSKTAPASLPMGLGLYSGRFPRWGSMQNGVLSARIPWEGLSSAKERGSWVPTGRGYFEAPKASGNSPKSARAKALYSSGLSLPEQIGGTPSPEFLEWLVGWPIGWTDNAALGMPRFQSWLLRLTKSSEVA